MTFVNPLMEKGYDEKFTEPCILTIFGATGDLTKRKLLPALYHLAKEELLPENFACIGFARRDKSDEIFRREMKEAVEQFSRSQPIDQSVWQRLEKKIYYHKSSFDEDKGYEEYRKLLYKLNNRWATQSNHIFYLATQPKHFPLIAQKLAEHRLSRPKEGWARLVIEKPFGHDLTSAEKLQKDLMQHFDEDQIFRIDHYLGKETVQNLMVFRLSNPIIESLWNKDYIDHVQITVAEDQGIGTRGHLFEGLGIVRDIIQNHMMQLISLVAMEPPNSFDSHAIRNNKVELLKAIVPIETKNAVFGQYTSGLIHERPVQGYLQEKDVCPNSSVETFAALKLFIQNPRWQNIPFYLRCGKRLAKKCTEIAIIFKKNNKTFFPMPGFNHEQNALVIRIQPNEGISMRFNCKVPGISMNLQPVKMDFLYNSYFGTTPPEAYERLICDTMSGDKTLFARDDEVFFSWKILDPIFRLFEKKDQTIFPYRAGSWGPNAANNLIEKDNHKWRLI